MKKHVVFLLGFAVVGLVGCGGAVVEPVPPPAPLPEPEPTPEPERPPEQASIQRVESTESRSKCAISPEEDGTNMVACNENDWFLYAPQSAEIDCGKFGGNVTISDGPLVITIKPLMPSNASGKEAERQLREQAVGFVKSALGTKYGSGGSLQFKEAKLGRFKRNALCVDADLDLKGTPGKVVACITSKTNINDEVLVHRSVWVAPAEQYDPKATPKKVKEVAANWFLYSDTDGMGRVLRKW